MNSVVEDTLNKLKQCDDFHNRCDCLLEHSEITYLLDYIKELNNKIEDDKMIIEGNLDCINNLKKDYILYKSITKEIREYIEKQITFCTNEANGTINDKICRITIQYLKHLKEILDKENKH